VSRANRIVLAVFAFSLLLTPAAEAATISPTTLADDNTVNGNCTLREAVRAANADAAIDACPAGSGTDTITLAEGTYGLSVVGTGEAAAASGDLDITDSDGLTIAGNPAGTTVDAKGIDRVFEVIGPATASFHALTITGGVAGAGAFFGGGIEATGVGAQVTVIRSTISANSAAAGGGADVVGGATLNIIDSTVTGNTAADDAGGINAVTAGILNVTNSTISGNSAVDDAGGINMIGLTKPTVNVLSSTITANSAADGGGSFVNGGNTLNLKGSIEAGNTGTASGPDCGGPGSVNSQGNNLIGSTSGCVITAQGSDITDQAPGLGPLADNGGLTPTHALAAGSPAIGKGPADAPAADQRGVPRSAPDIGAYEYATCLGVAINRVGTSGDDALTGTAGADAFLLLSGNDIASGLGGNDALCGADGNDSLVGGAGNDRARGDAGKDTLRGGSGKDNLKGGFGKDKVSGGSGKDRLFGGSGNDRLFGGSGNDRLFGGSGKDKLKGQAGRDSCKGGAGRDKALGCERRTKVP
jgi:CSLREA domain-containing protein